MPDEKTVFLYVMKRLLLEKKVDITKGGKYITAKKFRENFMLKNIANKPM